MAGGFFCFAAGGTEPSLVTLANPLQGTDSQFSFSHGNLYPAIALPFPMNTWAPYTQPQNDSFYYQYRHHTFCGIRQTHQPSPWIGDYANFSLMPVSGKLAVTETDRVSTFRHEDEIAQPGYYKVHLDTWDATEEVTPTLRGARFRFTFKKPADNYVVLDVFESNNPFFRRNHSVGKQNHRRLPQPPRRRAGQFRELFHYPVRPAVFGLRRLVGGKHSNDLTKLAGKHVGAFLKFDTSSSKVVGCKVASSFISPEQAELNLQTEIGGADFDTIRDRAEKVWNDALGRVQIEGGSPDQWKTFYSALYRSILFPHRFFELDTNNQPVYFSPYDGKMHQGFLYTDSGFWDTFRAAHPLYNLIFPEISARDFARSGQRL